MVSGVSRTWLSSPSAARSCRRRHWRRPRRLNVHLYGSLSATGKGHGTERAALAGLLGKEPATIDPAFLDDLMANPDKSFPVTLGEAPKKGQPKYPYATMKELLDHAAKNKLSVDCSALVSIATWAAKRRKPGAPLSAPPCETAAP